MDPITGAIVAIVLLLFSIPLVWVVAVVGFAVLADVILVDTAPLGGFFGWIVGIVYAAWAVIQVILQVIRLVQLLT